MKWTRTLQRHGVTSAQEGIEIDPFSMCAMLADEKRRAEIEYNLGTATEYGQARCGVVVRIVCPQSESAINLAAEIAFRKALELVNDGASHIGTPLLPPFEEP